MDERFPTRRHIADCPLLQSFDIIILAICFASSLLHAEALRSTGITPRGPLRAALPCLRHLPFELSLFGASPRYYGLVRLLASLSRTRLRALRVRLAPKVPFELRSSVHSHEVSRVPLLNFPDTRSSYVPRGRLRVASRSPSATCPPLRSGAFRFDHPSRFDSLLLAS